MTVRVVSYNVSGGLDLTAAARVLAELAPQVVCLLEVPSKARLRALARSAGLEVAARSGRRGTGTAVLVAPDVTVRAIGIVPLTTPRDVPAREATHGIVTAGRLRLSVTAVQLGLQADVRTTNLEELVEFLDSVNLPTVVGADLNTSIRSPATSVLADRYQDAFARAGSGSGNTYPTADPSTRQDFVFVDPRLRVVACHVPAGFPADVASHHRPVVADVAAAGSAEERMR